MNSQCRLDKGRALQRVAMKLGSEEAFIQFADGKRYKIGPVWDIDAQYLTAQDGAAGCWFNKAIRRRPRYWYQRVSIWPKLPQAGWVSAEWPPMPHDAGVIGHLPA